MGLALWRSNLLKRRRLPVGYGSPDAFGFGLAGHEVADGVEGVEVLEEDLVDGLGDGHFDVVGFGEFDDGFGGGDAFDDSRNFF